MASRYAVSTQLTSAGVAERSFAITGADTATRLVLSAATNAPADAIARGLFVICLGSLTAERAALDSGNASRVQRPR